MILVVVTALIVLAGVTRYAYGVSRIVAFVFATLALAGVAWVVSMSIEQVGRAVGPGRSPASCSRRSPTFPSSSW